MSEAFLYLWYDALKNMFYLGKHKGSPADKYTHSSTVWESFTKNNIPEGVTREILAYGTDEEMCILEHKLLVEAKNGGDWDRYYNESLGDPRYVDQSRENNPMYKHGKTIGWGSDPKVQAEYRKTPERKVVENAWDRERNKKPERIAYMQERYLRKKAET